MHILCSDRQFVAEYLRNVLTMADSILHTKYAEYTGQLDSSSHSQHADFTTMERKLRQQRTITLPFVQWLRAIFVGHLPGLWYDIGQHINMVRNAFWQCGRATTYFWTDKCDADAVAMESAQTDTVAYFRLLSPVAARKWQHMMFSQKLLIFFFVFRHSIYQIVTHSLAIYSFESLGRHGYTAIWPPGTTPFACKCCPRC